MKFTEFLKKDFKIVENRKYFFLVPAIILIVALIFAASFAIVKGDAGEALNLGMDFTGGYKMTVKLGDRISAENTGELKSQINQVFADNGVKDTKITMQSEGSDKSFVIAYKGLIGKDDDQMEELNDGIIDALEKALLTIVPQVSVSGQTVTAKYFDLKVSDTAAALQEKLVAENFVVNSVNTVGPENGTVSFVFELASVGETTSEQFAEFLTVKDPNSGNIIKTGKVSGSVSDSLIKSALLAVGVALVVMLIYILIRFSTLGFSAALGTVIALAHDLLIMFCFMTIFRIEIGSTFIAALITILGYSINNTIVIFDRVREETLMSKGKMKPAELANSAVKSTFWRSVNTTITTLVTIVCLAIFCVDDVRVFALPIIAGLLAGVYSSMVIAPSIWAVMQEKKLNKIKKSIKSKKKA